VLSGRDATIPVRVGRLGGLDSPVKVWVEGLPERVESQSVIAEPVNTKFRGTFGEDFFFDGTNVDLPVQAHAGAPLGSCAVRIRARGTMRGKILERTAVVFYPWQQTGYIHGRADDQELLLTVAEPPLFDIEGPAKMRVTRGNSVEIRLKLRWFGDAADIGTLRIEAGQGPKGLRIDRFEVHPGGSQISVWATAGDEAPLGSHRLSLVASVDRGAQTLRRSVPDIQLETAAKEDKPRVATR